MKQYFISFSPLSYIGKKYEKQPSIFGKKRIFFFWKRPKRLKRLSFCPFFADKIAMFCQNTQSPFIGSAWRVLADGISEKYLFPTGLKHTTHLYQTCTYVWNFIIIIHGINYICTSMFFLFLIYVKKVLVEYLWHTVHVIESIYECNCNFSSNCVNN